MPGPEEESGIVSSLVGLLERESRSEVFLEGISYALLKVAERGLLYAAEILLRYGADLNFEGTWCVCCPLSTRLYMRNISKIRFHEQRTSQERLMSDSFDPRLAAWDLKTPRGAFGVYVTGNHLTFLRILAFHFLYYIYNINWLYVKPLLSP